LTETDVAAAVADGEADCGLAVGAVARRFGLDFVPLERERFDLALRRRSYFDEPLQRLFGFVRSDRFRRQAEALGSYDVSGTGAVEFNA
jgi:molybdate-binding protein